MQIVEENKSLKSLNTFGVDACANYFVEVFSVEGLEEILKNDKYNKLPILFLGGGSNILFTKNFNGLVVKLNIKGISEEFINEEEVLVTAKAGENWHDFVLYCIKKNYGGLENLSLIPGNVGACPIQNIGAYGVEIKDKFVSCKAINIETKQIEYFNKEKCNFGYRDSFFKKEGKGKYAILEVSFRLTRKEHNLNIDYGIIKNELDKKNISQPNINDISEAIIEIRKNKLPDPKEIGSAGSFFKNPVISIHDYDRLKSQFIDINGYETAKGIKISAAWLIEKCGWKGKEIGNVATHHLQALVIINSTGKATGQEIFDFSTNIINSVKEKFGITLEREVNVV